MRKKALSVLAALAVLALAGPIGSASARASHSVSLSYTVVQSASGTNKGTFSGTPFGKGSLVLKTQKQGVYVVTLSAKGGTVTFVETGGPAGGGKIVGTCKFTKGTGKYSGISGKGKLTGVTSGKFTVTGSVTY